MGKDVFKVVYEVPVDHHAVKAHFDAVAAAAAKTWEYVEKLGALGYYTSGWDGGLHGVVFADLIGRADLWRVLERVYHEKADKNTAVLCVPKKTKIAAATRAEFEAVPAIPKSENLARELGWPKSRHDVTDGSKIYFATVHKIELPTERVFLRAPRQIGDGFEPPEFWTERTEGDYMRAIEAHNAMVPEDDE